MAGTLSGLGDKYQYQNMQATGLQLEQRLVGGHRATRARPEPLRSLTGAHLGPNAFNPPA